jgi:hypothetical protein
LSKQQSSLSYIFKIHSSRLRNSNWNLNLGLDEAIKNKELISIGDSAALRFIRQIENKSFEYTFFQEQVNNVKLEIKKTKKLPTDIQNRKKIKLLYDKLYDLLFIKHFVCIVIDKNKDFDRLNSTKGFFINGTKFKRLLATTGGAKNSTVVYVSDVVFDELNNKIENDRINNKQFVPAKLEAYKSLVCSGSTPVSNPRGVLVVKDCVTTFKTNVIKIDDTDSEYPIITNEQDFEILLEESDGYGLISPYLSEVWGSELGEDYIPSGFCVRNSYAKGMLFTFDLHQFASEVAEQYFVIDAWGHKKDIRNVEVVLTTSMLKLWDSYKSIEHYLECCEKNGYTFSVTKITPKELENQRNLNYQFIQSLDLSDQDIDELTNPTVKEIHEVLGGDYRKSLLFLKGTHIAEEDFIYGSNDFTKALMVDARMIDDPFVRNKIHNMIKKRIKDAKVGVLKVHGNYSTISGDPYSLCQSMFGLKVTGLLKTGEFYNKYWTDRKIDKVSCFRAPMTCHNNIRILRLVDNEKTRKWYTYMNTVTIFNSWGTTTHALNGADKDGDTVLLTDNPIIMKSIKELDAIVCVQKTATKKIVEEGDLIKANKDSFGDAIGTTTNRITSMFDVLANFEPRCEEYKELEYRIQCGQNYQQNAIDKTKGIVSKPMPKEWCDYKSNIIREGDSTEVKKRKELNLRILADKKPYFFIYIYPELMKEYKQYINNCERNCIRLFGLSLSELLSKQDKTIQEIEFINTYQKRMPVSLSSSVMNKICRKIESEFDRVSDKFKEASFDYAILKSNSNYSIGRYNKIKELYSEHNVKMQDHAKELKNIRMHDSNVYNHREVFVQHFKQKALELCNNEEELCNIVVDLCYKNGNKSKQFAWDICGEQMIKNLLSKNGNKYNFPILNEKGDIEFNGQYLSMTTKNWR